MIRGKILSLIAIVVALVCHEFAHGYVAYLLGDNTAKDSGRLSLNPLKHIDPMGLIFMLVFRIGWAKSVPITPNYFNKPRRDMILVALAGSVTNLILGAFFIVGFYKLPLGSNGLELFSYIISYNVMLGIFNLIPLPPLDGSKVIISLLPMNYQRWIYSNERWFYLVLIAFVFSGGAQKVVWPLMNGYINFLSGIF
ncbi:MAG: site-2 protease family protein [Tissierellia bacterium]|nr:site-2 protease family protein [Tissierellia bacterium]